MAGEIAAGLTAIRMAGEIVNGLIAARDIQKFSGELIALQSQIITAQSGMMALQSDHADVVSRERALKEEIVKLERWSAESERYALQSDRDGSIFYALKESMKGSDPPHRICANCYAKGKKTYLLRGEVIMRRLHVECSVCKTSIPVSGPAEYA